MKAKLLAAINSTSTSIKMNMNIVAFLFTFTLLHGVGAQSWPATPPDFSKMSYVQADEAVSEAEEHIVSSKSETAGPGYIANIVRQIRSRNIGNDKKVLAILLLGELRPSDTNAIEVLIDNIDFKPTRLDLPTRVSRWGPYPAEEALFNIGKPVISPVLGHLAIKTTQLRLQLMCAVLVHVQSSTEAKNGVVWDLSAGKATAQKQVEDLFSAERGRTRKANLQLALNELKK